MLARIPPTLRCPLSPSNPAFVAAEQNFASRSASPVTKVTFICDRLSAAAVGLKSRL